MPRNRILLAIFFTAITAVGIAAGVKIAQIEKVHRITETGGSNQTDRLTYDSGDVRTDDSFFTGAINKVVDSIPKVEEKDIPSPIRSQTKEDPVKAEAYIVGDLDSGEIYIEKNSKKVYPFASMSKLITALVAGDIYQSSTTIAVTQLETEVPADASALTAGEKFTMKELLYPMLMNSSNVAAEAIASSTDRVKFLELMSSYAWEIGMPDAFFADPTGLSERNAGTAAGFFAMAQYIYKKHPEILAITKIPTLTTATTTSHGSHVFTNIHPFVSDPRFLGGKTGHTSAAQDTMLTIMKISGKPIAIIVLRSPNNRAADTKYLISKLSI